MASKHILHFFIVKHDRACASNRRMCGTMKAKRGFKHPLFYFFNPSIICVYPDRTVPFLKERYPKNFCRGRPHGTTTGYLRLVRWAGIFRRGALIIRLIPKRARRKSSPTQSGRHGQSIPQGCALKSFWFFLFTTDAASEGNANMVCKLPSGEEENERSEVKKNSTLKGKYR